MLPTYNFQTPQYQQNRNAITWVQGIEGAKAYQVAPNGIILLMDSENEGIFYIKVTDNIGMATLRTFKYEEVTSQESKKDVPQVDLSEYVKKSELALFISEILKEKEVAHEQPVSTVTESKPKPLIQR